MIMPFRSQDPEVTAQGRSSRPQLEGIAWLEKSPLASSSLVFPFPHWQDPGQAGQLASSHHHS